MKMSEYEHKCKYEFNCESEKGYVREYYCKCWFEHECKYEFVGKFDFQKW